MNIVVRRRAPDAVGLTQKGTVTTILNERDAFREKLSDNKVKLKKILALLLNGQEQEAKKALNMFLFDAK